ncbi:MAG: hypothetical protein ACYCST_12990 [Acidimicrobiales bacterium]
MTRLSRINDVHRLDLGFFVRPASETGTGEPRVEAVYGYLVTRPVLAGRGTRPERSPLTPG